MNKILKIFFADGISSSCRLWVVWTLRILVGATFIISGFAKCIDIWGFSYKIGEYMITWGFDIPHALCVMAAMGLSVAEFVLGSMLLLGCYKRSSSWLLLAIMCGMLPLSFYIFIANPVADCGCFGDFWVISNGATFLKNIFLTAALLFLAFQNRKVNGLYRPFSQWMCATACAVYVIVIALWGYNVQPLIDFRSFPIGSRLVADDEADDADVDFEFFYEKAGTTRSFSADSLPDSTWTFVERRAIGGHPEVSKTDLVVYEAGQDVTDEVVSSDGPQLIVVVPDFSRAGISNTYALNELNHAMDSIGGSMFEVAAISDADIERWKDLSMAEYPIYQSDATVLKELSRGVMSAVFLRDGIIVWKRTVPSINLAAFTEATDKNEAFDKLAIDSRRLLLLWTGMLLSVLLLVGLVNLIVVILRRKHATPQSEEKDGEKDDEL